MENSKILIVDDEEIGRDALEALLSGKGYDLFLASSGHEALEKSLEIKPDLILLDVMMPGMDGFEVCRYIRQDFLLSEIPVILVTALDDKDSLLEGINSGADDFISKPYNRTELLARVKTITKLNRYRRLNQERKKFEWVVENSEDGYVMLDDKQKVLYLNSKARLCLGLSDDIIINDMFMDLVKKQYYLHPAEAWKTWPDASSLARYLVRPETDHSTVFWLKADFVEMSSPAEGSLVRLHDSTEEITSNYNIWTFHNLVSHKLRTPLTAIDMIFELFKTRWSNFPLEQLDKMINMAHNSLLRTREQILNVLNTIDDIQSLKPGYCNYNTDEIDKIVLEIKNDLKLDDVTTSYGEINESGKIFIAFTPPVMEMVLRELLKNSKKFHPSNSPSIEICVFSVSQYICFRISDDGMHLSPEQLSKMWLPYHQAEKFFTGELPGMGLGLSKIAFMVSSAGGSCKSYNRSGCPGIVVEIMLPVLTE